MPLSRPVETSFGVMRDRPAVFARVEDRDGAAGWGEVFANWPAAGAEHRCDLLARDVAPLAIGRDAPAPAALFDAVSRDVRIVALQSGEQGPFAQVIAGLDAAVWDLCARRAGRPLKDHLAAGAPGMVPAYASGIALARAPAMVAQARAAGFAAAKVKVGFGAVEAERAAIAALRGGADATPTVMADANQAWDVEDAARFLAAARDLDLGWVEEPVVATAPDAAWRRLASCGPPLAGGENLMADAFDAAISARCLAVIQPDVAKWGGVTGCLRVARATVAAGLRYCPHFLGGGIGLAASAHLLAAAGGTGLLEVDVNANVLRDAFARPGGQIVDGAWRFDGAPGIGIAGIPPEMTRYETHRVEVFA